MNLNAISDAASLDDAQLVESVLNGNREAFGQLVSRYQSSVCAVAYSACGNVSQSEDLAQESFIVAWRKLRDLKEPAKFKSWLFGIARNLVNNSFRRQARNPLAAADSLHEDLSATAPGADPVAQTMNKEEEAIMWRSLEMIPADYREALVLFYREQQSIGRVAEVLEISEDATRQRLSRGRKMLQEQVLAVVEGALTRTVPGHSFTMGVMGALPALTMTALTSAVGGTAVKGSAASKAAAAAGALGPFAMIVPAGLAVWMGSKLHESERERKFSLKAAGGLAAILFLYVMALVIVGVVSGFSPRSQVYLLLASSFGFVAILIPYTFWMARMQKRIREEEFKNTADPRAFSMSNPYEYRSGRTFLGWPLVHVRFNGHAKGNRLPAKGWIAVGETAYGFIAIGAVAVGMISWGAVAVGGIALGGAGVGLLAFGGLAVGGATIGGVSIGYLAFGGAVVAWLAGTGGAVLSHHFALGGGVIAENGNNEAARTFIQNTPFFRYSQLAFWPMCALSFVLPPALQLYFKKRAQRRLSARSI